MENPDRIGSDAIRLEARIAFLESRVRNFRIAVAGPSTVEGGFGKLKPSDALPDRLANLEQAFAKFRLQGNGLSASGSIEKGYMLSA